MKTCGILAASLFGALVAAMPVNKRAVVWVTQTDVAVVTVDMTKTVWVGADEATSTPAVNQAAYHPTWTTELSTTTTEAPSSTSSSVYVAPTTSSSSVYVAPTTSSSSVYVAPTTSSSSVYVAPTTSSSSVYVAPTTSSISVDAAPATTSSSSVYVAPTTSSSSSVYVAPTTSSTSVYVAPTTTEAASSTSVAPSTTSSSAAATSSSSSSSGSGLAASGTSYTGDLTWYQTGSGACGWDNTASDHIVAISHTIFDDPQYAQANPNNNPLCGRYVSITGVDGSQYQAKVVDRCTGCLESDLDLSEDFFNTVTDNGNGRVHDMTWVWV